MHMDSLLYLLEISKCKSMSEASQKIHITPQALSISIKNLEHDLGIQLLIRTNKGISVTEKGRELVRLTEEYFQNINQLTHKVPLGIFEHESALDIYSNNGGAHVFLPILISHLYQAVPNLKIDLHTMLFNEAVERLLNNEIPYAFFDQCFVGGRQYLPTDEKIQFHPLFRTHIIAFVPDKFPISKAKALSWKDVIRYPILQNENMGTTLNIPDFYRDFGKPDKLLPVSNQDVLKQMLAAGLGIALRFGIPYQEISSQFNLKNVRAVPIIDSIETYFGYIMRTDEPQIEPKHRALLDYVCENLYDILQNN